MFYDLHIHSCLSPCAENEMTPNNICGMAMIKGLDVIAVTDHNSTRQLPAVAEATAMNGLKFIYGCELESSEEVHLLGYFKSMKQADLLQNWINSKMPDIMNKTDFFGEEEIMNSRDEMIGIEERLLIVSLNASLSECIERIHELDGTAVLAHVMDRKNSVTTQLGFIPMDLPYDGLEVKSETQKEEVLKLHPWINENKTIWLYDSDAHRLTDISEAVHEIDTDTYMKLCGENV
ncbi:MAG: PHP domain-containing protein [Erysipelotrichia bacterium]|nr:PHP domain-containing protein [Erysipelotrichia bacterium]